jgi:hypothetical protein
MPWEYPQTQRVFGKICGSREHWCPIVARSARDVTVTKTSVHILHVAYNSEKGIIPHDIKVDKRYPRRKQVYARCSRP